ncbi:helical backbone metal receptor [Aequorivita sp. SDUM287046]|uniref:Helical backbone metal receptor n=1 Tax=Aequorivita aurantiaca TaxID=3053356 RepID=A0ABT8DL55_9FLAO|nr:helical backbone metal receptor [Aequorivita aurantiaca]MDN3724630.1 helical backbone metal receptor [Aequorivita aurantiaca]
MEFIDQIGRRIDLNKTPSRIVSLVPSQTELIVTLGLETQLVGITKFCVHPSHLRAEKTIVGGTKKVNYEKIKALQPDVIICNKEENTREMVLRLETIAPVWVSDISSISQSNEMIEKLGTLFGKKRQALNLISKIETELNDFQIYMKLVPRKKVIYTIWKDPFMAAGRNTFINTLLELNNFENCIIEENSRYPIISLNEMDRAELVLLSTEPYPFNKHHVVALQNEIRRKVRLVNGEYFSWYGSRLLFAFDYFRSLHQV